MLEVLLCVGNLGAVDTREWTDAALLPPIGRLPGGASDGHDTRIYLGWLGENLLVAIKNTRKLKAGPYLVRVEASQGGEKVAAFTRTVCN